MDELTDAQIERQDTVDNAIYNLICNLSPAPSNEKIKWDIEVIGRIRDALSDCYTSLGLCTELEFYPYLEMSFDDMIEDSCPECGGTELLWHNTSGDFGCNNCGWQEGQIL